jgi:type IX secretion system PorP/SprF family membrane protein
MRGLITLFFLFFCLFSSQAQDIHYTQYNMSPISLNPAMTGAFHGTFRIGAIYRDQWFNVPDFSGSFKTPNLFIDAPIIKGFRDQDWVGVGANIFQDQAGALELTFGSFLGSAAYHLGLDKESRNVITLGLQAGYISRKFNNAIAADFEDDMETLGNTGDGITYFDMNAGVMIRTFLSNNMLLEAGLATFHLTGPDYAIKGRDKLPLRYDIHARLKTYLTDAFTLTPSFLYKGMNAQKELSLQVVAGLTIDPEKEMDLNLGLGYRITDADALEILAGIDWGNFRGGIGYDLGISSFASSSNAKPGAFEFAVSYIAKIYKKPDPKPTIFCPRF